MTTTIHKPIDLKITQQAWEPAIRALLLDDEAYAVGSIRWNRHAQSDEALVDAIEITRQPPTGTSRSPLDDFLIIWMDRDGLGRQVDRLARWQPRMSQAMLLLMLDGRNRERWAGEVWREGHVERLQSWTIVGGGMFHVAHAARVPPLFPADPDHSDPDNLAERFSRIAGALSEELHAMVRRSVVTQVGCGRNGTLMAWQLACLGVSRLRLIDGDVIEPPNLDTPGLRAADVGQPKAQALAQTLLEFRPDLSISWLQSSVTDPAASEWLAAPSDLIVSCVDSDAARLRACVAAKRSLTPYLDVASTVQRDERTRELQLHGDALLLLPDRDGGCLSCVGGLTNREATMYELAAPANTLKKDRRTAWHSQRSGSLVTLNSTTVSTGVQAWLSLLRGDINHSQWFRIDWQPNAGFTTQAAVVGSNPDCTICRSIAST
ncbi:MAG: ThiF family adenylyltransferase [Planctomycetia bacterium]|nr:ThiF family adenylyltransferase [Planctomycetia bacterium]